MTSLVRSVLVSILVLTTVAASAVDSTATNDQILSAADYLPPASMLDGKWTITGEGDRTKEQLADAIGPNGDELLTSWRWRENVYRDLTRVDPASFPDETTYINVSIHRFADAEGASEALDVWSNIVVAVQGLQDTDAHIPGYRTRGMAGPGDGVNLYLLYVQDDKYVLRIGGSSAAGDPSSTIDILATRILTQLHSNTPSTPSSGLSLEQTDDYELGQTVVVTFPSKPLRKLPTSSSQVVRTVVEGDLLKIIDGTPTQANGLTWWNVEVVSDGQTGWLADNVFAPSQENSSDESGCWTSDQTLESDGAPSWIAPPAMTIDPGSTYIATIATTEGKIILQLDAANAPVATNNFVCLANAGYYDDTIFHRISSDFLIQAGDHSGTGTGGPGYTIPSDPTTGDYPEGSIALANSTPDQNGSQFFIAAADLTGSIPDDYPVFGHVVAGQEIVATISHGAVDFNPRGERSQPLEPTMILSVEITRQDDEVGPPLPTMPSAADAPPIPTVAVAPTVALPPTTSAVINLEAIDIAFKPNELTMNASDEPVTIKMVNTGAAEHDFTIDSLDISVNVQPGDAVDIVIPAGTAPGDYDFYCNIPGHKEAGMVGKLIVNGGSGTTSSGQTTASTGGTDKCVGLSGYQQAYDDALYITALLHPAAADILINWDDGISDLEDLAYTDLAFLTDFYSDLAEELAGIPPPQFAAEWHELQVQKMLMAAIIFEKASTVGIYVAAVSYSSEIERINTAIDQVFKGGNPCQQFVTWAADY